jgi:hypothetical protein
MSAQPIVTPNLQPSAPLPPSAPSPVAPDAQLTRLELISVLTTVALAIGLAIFAGVSTQRNWVLWLAVSVGGLGGLAHEFAQSGGKLLFFERKLDGIYMGSLAGMVLGAVAGLLTIRGYLVDPTLKANLTQISYEVFIAGLGLKGVIEAAGGQPLPPGQSSVTPGQAMAAEAALTHIGTASPATPDSVKNAKLPAPPPVAPNA